MSYKSDVKAKYLTASGSIFSGRARIKGVYIVPGTSAGTVVVNNNGSAVATFGAPANGQAVYVGIPEDGLLCETSADTTMTNIASATFFYA